MDAALDAAAGGALNSMGEDDAFLVERMATNNHQCPTDRRDNRQGGILQVDVLSAINAQFAALNKKIDSMGTPPTHTVASCGLCGDAHHTESCALLDLLRMLIMWDINLRIRVILTSTIKETDSNYNLAPFPTKSS